MNTDRAYTLANDLMMDHELDGWHFAFDRSIRRFGCCDYTHHKITLSRSLTEMNDEDEVRDTILHEIAHALVGHDHAHDMVWRQKAREVGCRAQRCYSYGVKVPPKKFIGTCPCGRITIKRDRRRKLRHHCGNAIQWTPNTEEVQDMERGLAQTEADLYSLLV
jgi:predicted SprT family Zn-dependent metalloprotease